MFQFATGKFQLELRKELFEAVIVVVLDNQINKKIPIERE